MGPGQAATPEALRPAPHSQALSSSPAAVHAIPPPQAAAGEAAAQPSGMSDGVAPLAAPHGGGAIPAALDGGGLPCK